ncbi:hypothetical protein KJ059_16325 [Myxococcota bacterium]|nr:hypothetical protein [Myxococcota bacterium]MCZ7616811.1 hypothetical protein [Myxococcota bacterium]
MQRLLRRALMILFLCMPGLLACSVSAVRVELADFGAGRTDGIWLWKPVAGSYARQCRIDLSDPFWREGREVVSYLQSCLDGQSSNVPWTAEVERLPGDPETVRLVLVYRRSGTALPHRASAFNAAGESALSSTSLML